VIGEMVFRTEACSLAACRRVAAMLDRDPDGLKEGDPLPRGWQFILLGADTPRSALREDGFPGLGVPIPDLGLPRLMIGGRFVRYLKDIPIGSTIRRASAVERVVEKNTPGGPMAIVDIGHSLSVEGGEAIVETQTYLLLSGSGSGGAVQAAPMQIPGEEATKVVTPDETLLFQYSALGFNSHRIHLDKAYAREVEGFPDLVVNGGLTNLMMTEFLTQDLRVIPRSFRTKHTAPLFCNQPVTLSAKQEGEGWEITAYDYQGTVAARMGVEVA
jgi:3-methylfumaryl-CoA hydratase